MLLNVAALSESQTPNETCVRVLRKNFPLVPSARCVTLKKSYDWAVK